MLAVRHSAYDMSMGRDTSVPVRGTFLINSASRNKSKQANPSMFDIVLPERVTSVRQIRLGSACIPRIGHTITSSNNVLRFQDDAAQVADGSYYHIELDVGAYPISDGTDPSIILNLEAAMNASSTTGSTYDVSLDEYNGKVTITQTSGSGIFNLLFAGPEVPYGEQWHDRSTGIRGGDLEQTYHAGCIGKTLGFSPLDLSGELSYTGQSNYSLLDEEYIVIMLKYGGSHVGKIYSSMPHLNRGFALLYPNEARDRFIYRSDATSSEAIKVDMTTKPKVERLAVELRRPNGDLYDLQGLEWNMVLEIESLEYSG